MGEVKPRELASRHQLIEALRLETASGGLKVPWAGNAQVSAMGQMAFFTEFLTVTGLFDQQTQSMGARSCNHTSRPSSSSCLSLRLTVA